ncbi:McrC family protein [Sorangium sp. So ce513]|uniref:McrC family protein n=1 Tax=Sorangium sp. So ce513 TaxID=3133315 RepID=UPI003F5D9DCD
MDRSIVLSEWERRPRGLASDEALAGLSFEDPAIERAALALREGGRLLVSETRHGLSIEARAHVGVVQLGPLRVTVLPKIATEDLWYILAYGLGLDVVDRRFPNELLLPDAPFADILALLLLEEANALLRRGLRRGYSAHSGWLGAPRGRLELAKLASAWPLSEAALPCTWHELSSDTLDNQVVRAGLRFARKAVLTPELRGALNRAERAWEERCSSVHLDAATLARVERERTRLTAAYEPAHHLVTLLWSGAGMPDDLEALSPGVTPIPGLLWNMATLFERFVARFLREHVESGTVDAQVPLTRLYRVAKGPPDLRAPKPRPDLTVSRGGRVVMVLDTKYRDLATKEIGEGILYQLSIYGVAFSPKEPTPPVPVVALYPGNTSRTEDTVIELRAPGGRGPIPICIRPVAWVEASRAVRSVRGRSRAIALAEEWIRTT